MKPEHRTIEECQPLKQRIVPADVLVLMRQHGIELCLRPFAPSVRQDRDGMQPSYSDRAQASRTGKMPLYAPGLMHEPIRAACTHCQPKQQYADTQDVNAQHELSPIHELRCRITFRNR